MGDTGDSVFEITPSGIRVAGTGQPRLEAAARAGEVATSREGVFHGWRSAIMHGRRRPRVGDPRGQRADPYAGERGPGRISRWTRVRMDLWGYGSGSTNDVYGTEADVRAISERNPRWAGFKLRVLTQNLWGLPVISRCLEARVHAFAKTLANGWDVIALQEVWHARERDALRRAALSGDLRYSRYFEHGCGAPVLGAGMGGTGLLVLSRFPIAESFFWRFSANGQPYQLQHSDYLGGKGVGLARIHTPAGAVDLFVSHLHADYSRATGSGTPDRYKAHRVAQAFEVAHIIRIASRSPLVILLSDLNAGPGSMPYGLQRSVAGLGDAFAEAKPDEAGYTCEATDNVFSNGRDPPARLDYVFFKALPPPLCSPQPVEPTWELSDCWVHRAHIPEQDTDEELLAQIPKASASAVMQNSTSATATSGAPPGTLAGMPAVAAATSPRGQSPVRSGSGGSPLGSAATEVSSSSPMGTVRHRIDGVGAPSPLLSRTTFVANGDGRGSGSPRRVVRRINLSDHHGVAAEFIAKDPEVDDDNDDEENLSPGGPPRLIQRRSQSIVQGTFPQGPLLARALTEMDRGIEVASARRNSHLRAAKALAVLWIAFLAGGAVAKSSGPIGFMTRGAAGVLGGFLCAAASALFLVYWFSAKEEVQGLREVFQTATNYERHLPMEEALPDGGFDTSQFYNYMERNFR